jgi:hypothetical protein
MDERIHERATSSSTPAPQQAPQQYLQQPPPVVLQNPIPHQGVMNTQQEVHPAPPQMGQYQNPGPIHPGNLVIAISSSLAKKKFFCKHGRQYNTPPESTPTTSEAAPATTRQPLMIPCPNTEPTIHIPHIPLRRMSITLRLGKHTITVWSMTWHSLLQPCLYWRSSKPVQLNGKSLLSTLGAVDPADTRLITFDLDSGEPRLPTLVAFQIPVKIQNITVHRCIIDEGASTCIMSKTVWKKLGSPELVPSAITLRAYDGRPSSPEGLFQNVPVELGGKTILIDIEVIDAPLDYNILFGRSYMYAMKAVASSVFRTMMFPHNGKIITIDQITHYEPNHSTNIDNILPLVRTSSDAYSLIDMGPRIFKDPSLLGAYHGAPPLIHPSTQVCVISSNGTNTETPFLPLRPLHTSTFHQLKKYYLKNSLRTLLHHLSLISPPPPPPPGENPSLGDNPSSHYSNSLLLPPTWSSSISGSHDAYPSQHGAFHPCMVSTPTHNGSSTISPSSARGNPDADSSTGSGHTTLTPNC